MSRCFTLKCTGFADDDAQPTDSSLWLSNGIVVDVSSTPGWPHSIDVGRNYEYEYFEDQSVLRLVWRTLGFDRQRPPTTVTCRDGSTRIVKASVITVKDKQYIRAEYPGQGGTLVHIDTGHTEPCLDGGHWVVRNGSPRVIMQGREGLRTYQVHHRGGSFGYIDYFAEPSEEVDHRAAWDIGLLLFSPGDSVEVHFKAPGKVTGVLTCIRSGELRFELTSNEVDKDYEWEPIDYQEEQDIADDWRRLERSYLDFEDDLL